MVNSGTITDNHNYLLNTISYEKDAPPAPSGLNLFHGSSCSLQLDWIDVANETGYEVWRKYGSTDYVLWWTLGKNENTFLDMRLTPNTKYWYKIRAINTSGSSAYSATIATTASARNDNETLRVKRMRFSTDALKAVEKYLSGAPEIRLRVVKGSENGASTVFTSRRMEPDHRSDIENTWWNYEFDIFDWSTSTYGTVLTFDWKEEDWEDNVEFNIYGSFESKIEGGIIKAGGSVTIKGDNGGGVIGNTSVLWWQNRDKIYNLCDFEWQFDY